MRHYAEAELEGVVSLDEAIDGLRAAFVDFASGGARVQLRTPTQVEGLKLNTMAAVLPSRGVCGAKVYTAFEGRFSFVILLFSMRDGRVLASFDAGALTRLRTAAVSALAASHLARPDCATLAVFGTGTQAAGHVEAFASRFPIGRILVVGRASAADFARRISAATGVEATVASAGEALAQADLIVTATRAATPLFDGRQLRAGTTVIAVGSSRPEAAEIDVHTIERCGRIVVESFDAARHEAGDLLLAAKAGFDPWGKVGELGALLAGRIPGRTSPAEITLFESLGFALEDVAIAAIAHERLHARTLP